MHRRSRSTLQGNRLRVDPGQSSLAAAIARFPSPGSDEGHWRAPPSPTGAVYHGSTNKPEIDYYRAAAAIARGGSPESVTATAVNEPEERVNTEALRRQLASATRTRRERFDPEALAALVSDPSLDGSSDGNGEEDEPAVHTPQTPPAQATNANSWQTNCDIVDWDAEFDLPEGHDDGESITANVPQSMDYQSHYRQYLQTSGPPTQFLKPIFKPRGRWAFSEGQDLTNVRVIKSLGEGGFTKVYIKEGELYGEKITFVSKEWNLHANSLGFFSELVLYMSPRYLLELQGDCIPEIIGIFQKGRTTTVAFALPHANSWVEAHPDMPVEVKDKIVEAYEKIHAKGVTHTDVGYRHMLVGDDHKVTIIDFNYSGALEAQYGIDLFRITAADLERELRQVKVKLRCEGAVEHELNLIQRYKELKALDDLAYEERRQAARAAREARRGKKRKAPGDVSEVQERLPEGNYGLTDDECPRDCTELCGVNIKLLQTEDDLYTWLTRAGVSRRMVVPCKIPDLGSLPPYDPLRKEDEIISEFIRRHTNGAPAAAAPALVPPPPTAAEATLPLTSAPVLTILNPTPGPVTPRSFWSLPQTILRKVNRYLSAILPFTFTSPSSPPKDGEIEERPRKRARVYE